MTIISFPRRLLPKAGFVRNASLLAIGTIGAKSVAIVSAPLLTRFYTPDDFRALSGVLSITIILSALGTLQYYQAIPLPTKQRESNCLVSLCLLITATFVPIVAIAVFSVSNSLLSALSLHHIQPYLFLVPFAICLMCLHDTLSWLAVREDAFRKLSASTIFQGICTVTGQVIMGGFGVGPFGLIIGDAFGRLAAVIPLLKGRGANRRGAWKNSFRGIVAVARRYWRFAVLITPSNLLNRLTNRLPVLIILTVYGPTVAGWFALSDLVLCAPITLLGASIGKAYLGEAAQRSRSGNEGLRRLFHKTSLHLAVMGLPPLLITVFFGHHLFRIAFGDDWIAAGQIARMLAIGMYLKLIASTVSQTLHVLERQHIQFIWDVGANVAVVGSILVAVAYGWNSTDAIAAYATALAISYLAYLFLIWHSVIVSENQPLTPSKNTSI